MRTWKSVELERDEAEKVKSFLKRANIKYEPSECFNLIHIEAYVNDFETELIDEYIGTL